jgi:hypothetical protein
MQEHQADEASKEFEEAQFILLIAPPTVVMLTVFESPLRTRGCSR